MKRLYAILTDEDACIISEDLSVARDDHRIIWDGKLHNLDETTVDMWKMFNDDDPDFMPEGAPIRTGSEKATEFLKDVTDDSSWKSLEEELIDSCYSDYSFEDGIEKYKEWMEEIIEKVVAVVDVEI